MISQKRLRTKYILADFFSANVAFFLFDVARFYLNPNVANDFRSLASYLSDPLMIWEQILIPVVLLAVYFFSGFYNHPFERSRLQDLISTLLTSVFNTLLIYLTLLVNDQLQLRVANYEILLALFGCLSIATYIPRYFLTVATQRKFRSRAWSIPTLVLGSSEKALKTGEQLSRSGRGRGTKVVGFVAIPGETPHPDAQPLFSYDEIYSVVERKKIAQIIMVPDAHREEQTLRLMENLFGLNVPVRILPDTLSFLTSAIRLSDIYGEPLIDLTSPRMTAAGMNIKRAFDILASASALTVLAIPMAVIAIVIKAQGGPAFYSQERVGYRRKLFRIYKFRTMKMDAESDGKPALSSDSDPRVTPLGRVLRKYRIDEWPQFWNVLKGDMSLIGPRPERPYYISRICKEAPYYVLVHQVRPGITSWAMVKYGYARNVEEMVRRTRYDLIYLANMSLTVDLKIIIYTLKTIITGKGM